MVIDASAVTRYLLTEILEQEGDIEVIASIPDTALALDKIQDLRPHVVTLDVAKPALNGFLFLEKLMELHPTPVVIVSAVSEYQGDSALRAMQLGAVGYVGKQQSQTWSGILNLADEIIEKVRAASAVRFLDKIPGGEQATSSSF